MKCGQAVVVVRVGVSTSLQKQLDGMDVAALCGKVQGRFALLVGNIWIGTSMQHFGNIVDAPVLGLDHQIQRLQQVEAWRSSCCHVRVRFRLRRELWQYMD